MSAAPRVMLATLAGMSLSCREFATSYAACVAAGRCADDAGALESGSPDGGLRDGGSLPSLDAGAPDGGPLDGGPLDAGVDAGDVIVDLDPACGLAVPAPTPVMDEPCDAGGDVTITQFDVYVRQDRSTGRLPFSRPLRQLWVFDGGALVPLPVTRVDAGVWVATGVPAGQYLIDFDSLLSGAFRRTVLETCARHVDLSAYSQGRETWERLEATFDPRDGGPVVPLPATPVRFSLTGLAPWGAADELQATSVNAGLGWVRLSDPGLPLSAGQLPGPGATTADFTFDWTNLLSPRRVRAPLGDDLTVFQLTSDVTDAGVAYTFAARTQNTTSLDLVPGVAATVALPMEPVSRSQRVNLVIDVPSLDRALSTGGYQVEARVRSVAVDPSPAPVELGLYSALPDVFVSSLLQPDGGELGSTDGMVRLDAHYGNPFASTWSTIGYFGTDAVQPVPTQFVLADGGIALAAIPVSTRLILDAKRMSADGGVVLAAHRLVPPSDIALNNTRAGNLLSGGAINLELTVDSAGSCSPDYYQVIAHRLRYDSATDSVTRPAFLRVITRSARLTLPPGFFPGGGDVWVLRAAALRAPGWTSSSPLYSRVPFSSASTVVGGRFTVQ